MDGFDPKTLTEEKSLSQIAWRSRVLPWNRFNVGVTVCTALAAILYASISTRPYSSFADWDRLIASNGFALGAQVLGFLIAGFTIFATLTKPSLFRRMAVKIHKETGLTYLKYNFYAFVQVFIHYIAFTIANLLIILLGTAKGPGSEVLEHVCSNVASGKSFVSRFIFCLMLTWFIYVLVLLKSFVFNIYHVVMTAIRWDFEEQSQAAEAAAKEDASE
jgi:hypothetical protein